MIEVAPSRRVQGPRAGRRVAVLADCVAGGASVSSMAPFSQDDARAAFGVVAADVEQGRRVLLDASSDGRLVGTVQIVLALPPNQPHRGEISATPRLRAERWTNGRPYDTITFWKALR